MIRSILGAVAGAKAAEHTSKVGGAGGALLGVAAVSLFRRLSLPALLAVTAGGYALKKWNDKREDGPAPTRKKPVSRPRKSAAKSA